MREGQQATAVDPGETTTAENVDVQVGYNDFPWPGLLFEVQTDFTYARTTDQRVLTHSVSEPRTNPQVLLGQRLRLDKDSYAPGEVITLDGTIWDPQARACDAYHVVAHLISEADAQQFLRVVLHPIACQPQPPQSPPNPANQELCLELEAIPSAASSPVATRGITVVDVAQPSGGTITVQPGTPTALSVPASGLVFGHEPGRFLVLDVEVLEGDLSIEATNSGGEVVDTAVVSANPGVKQTVELSGELISGAVLRNASALVSEYCVTPLSTQQDPVTRCCFAGQISVPPDAPAGRWRAHLVVQNVNSVPDGTEPTEAATVIGGHIVTRNVAVIACSVVMLAEYTFDVI